MSSDLLEALSNSKLELIQQIFGFKKVEVPEPVYAFSFIFLFFLFFVDS